MSTISDSSSNNIAAVPDFVSQQIAQGIETFRSQFNLLVQVLTIFIVANVTIIGFAISERSAGMVVVAAVIPIIMIGIVYGASRYMVPVLYTVTLLEERYSPVEEDWLATTFLAVTVSPQFLLQFESISREQDPAQRMIELRRLRLRLIDKRSYRLLLIAISLMEFAGAALVYYFFTWPIF